MTYFWYSYSLYIVLGILFIIWILYNTWIINILAAITFVAFIYESHDSYVARKLCACLPILGHGYDELSMLTGAGGSQNSWVTRPYLDSLDRDFLSCVGKDIDTLYKEGFQISDVNNENIESDTWNGTPIFHPNFKNIAKLIEQRCPTVARAARFNWEELINGMDNN